MKGAPLRIRRPASGILGMADGVGPKVFSREWFGWCWTRFLKLIPSEVIMLYLVVRGFLDPDSEKGLWILTGGSLVLLIVIRAYATSDKDARERVQWIAVALSAISFVVWLYATGGIFAFYGIQWPALGSVVMLVWTLVLAFSYPGD